VAIDRKLDIIDTRIEKLEREREYLLSLPEDDFDDDAVLFFKKRFASGTTDYTYVAVKAVGSWYLSGAQRGNQPMRWEEVLEFCKYDQEDTELWYATEWEQV
jgi:hypothetical protein